MNYYETLGVNRSASVDQIKKAYKQLAKKYHPDRNHDAGATERFLAVTEAYDILSDPAEKMRYDAGIYSRRTRPKPEPKAPPKPNDPPQHKPYNDGLAPDPDDINCAFFGGPKTGRNILLNIKLTPEQMKHGGPHSVWIKKRDLCENCVGDGTILSKCPKCKGSGGIDMDFVFCLHCEQSGVVEGTCMACNGTGCKSWIVENVRFNISPGIQRGHIINVLGVGETAPRKAPGNLRIVVI